MERGGTPKSVVPSGVSGYLEVEDRQVTVSERTSTIRDEAGRPDTSAALAARLAELESHLRERVEENLVLDAEVRYLTAERDLLREYAADMAEAASRSGDLARRLEEATAALEVAEAEIDAYRQRAVCVFADHAAGVAARHPTLRRMAQRSLRTVRRRPS